MCRYMCIVVDCTKERQKEIGKVVQIIFSLEEICILPKYKTDKNNNKYTWHLRKKRRDGRKGA